MSLADRSSMITVFMASVAAMLTPPNPCPRSVNTGPALPVLDHSPLKWSGPALLAAISPVPSPYRFRN
jgi:hypothetical protein